MGTYELGITSGSTRPVEYAPVEKHETRTGTTSARSQDLQVAFSSFVKNPIIQERLSRMSDVDVAMFKGALEQAAERNLILGNAEAFRAYSDAAKSIFYNA